MNDVEGGKGGNEECRKLLVFYPNLPVFNIRHPGTVRPSNKKNDIHSALKGGILSKSVICLLNTPNILLLHEFVLQRRINLWLATLRKQA